MEKKKMIIYGVAIFITLILGYFAFIHELVFADTSLNQTEQPTTASKPTLPPLPSLPSTSTPSTSDEDSSTGDGSAEDGTTEDGSTTESPATDTGVDAPTAPTDGKLFAYTEAELKTMLASRDPFTAQEDLINLTKELKIEFDKVAIDPEDVEQNPTNPADSEPLNPTPTEPTNPTEPEPIEPTEPEPTEPEPTEPMARPAQIVTIEEVSEMVTLAVKNYQIKESWVYAIIEHESQYNQNELNVNKDVQGKVTSLDRGLMQINSKTAPWIAMKLGLKYTDEIEYSAETNIQMGVFYLSYLSSISDDPDFVFTAYNRGPSGANAFKEKNGSYVSEYSRVIKTLVAKHE